jgi:homoserine dehydrogenase
MKSIQVGLLGCGTVGTGVAKLLMESKGLIASRLGTSLNLKQVADMDTATDRGIPFTDGMFIDDAWAVVNDPDIDIVVEMIGGQGIARDLILAAFENGKHVVTANKAMIAAQGNRLRRAAADHAVDLAFEASVGGCMPIIKSIRESLVANRIFSMTGILNGTCNYILSQITEAGVAYDEALAEAQENGYAEADPTLDVEGIDTAHKLAILTALAYGMEINLDDIYVEGISRITPMDIDFASQFGYTIKLLAIGKDRGEAVEARVHPTMIPAGNPLTHVNGTLNAVSISADAVGKMMLYGHGAGMMPTASAVVSDLVDVARNMLTGSASRVPILSYQPEEIRPIPVLPMDDLHTHYYIRFSAVDQPGVLSRISGILGDLGISIQSVHQKGRTSRGPVPVVMLTHEAREAAIKEALARIEALDIINELPVVIRIEDENGIE